MERTNENTVKVVIKMPVKVYNQCEANQTTIRMFYIDLTYMLEADFKMVANSPEIEHDIPVSNGEKTIIAYYTNKDWFPIDNVVVVDFVNKRRIA